jgi:mono/diheme cytochrome c family protein
MLKPSVTYLRGVSLIGVLALMGVAIAAGNHSGGHGDDDSTQHASAGEMNRHNHDKWVDPPSEYTDLTSHKWADAEAIANGHKLYAKQCLICHGEDGQGKGPIAASLGHPPADLTNNFHTEPGNGDAYLFWRVTEGGLAEPFRSQGSAMPAFKDVLSVDERWEVLAYVHTFFHQGLMKWSQNGPNDEMDVDREVTTSDSG